MQYMENPQNLGQPKSIREKRNVGLGIHGSEAVVNDITSPSLPSRERQQNVLQANIGLGESTSLVLEQQKEIVTNIEIPERPTPNLIIGPKLVETALNPTNGNIRPGFKELETDKKPETAPEGWVKKAWEKINNLYFKPNVIENWENGKIYELLGVKLFKRFYDKHWSPKVISYSSFALKTQDRKSALEAFEKRTRELESIHLQGASVLGLAGAAAFYFGHIYGPPAGYMIGGAFGFTTTAVNFAYNFYPIITQRYNRVKVYNLLDKLNVREGKSNK